MVVEVDNEQLKAEKKRLKMEKKLLKAQKKEKKEKKKRKERNSRDDTDGNEKKQKVAKADGPAASSSSSNGSADLVKWMLDNEMAVTDEFDSSANWKPYLTFDELDVPAKVAHATAKFSKPTPIQSICWPVLLKNRDIIGIAETGSGKTFGFGLPAINHLHKVGQSKLPSILVMTPTRELALQIQEQFKLFGENIKCRTLCVFGGIPKREQRDTLKAGVDVIIACPGRLADLMQEGSCSLSNVSYVVLDEADRLLDSGFEKEVRQILSSTKSSRQSAMFSATWPSAVEKLAAEYLSKPVKVTIGSIDLGANANVTQIVEVIDPMQKERRITQLLKEYHSSRTNRVLIFALYKKEAARIEQSLRRSGWNCICIHGDMSQDARSKSFYDFKSGKVPLLIATDVAARGLDIPNVEYVINYTFPLTIEDYVHRIGRTGRAGNKGISHTFFTLHDKARSGELVNILKQTNQSVPADLMAFGTTVKKKEHSVYGAFFKEVDENVKGTKITFDSDNE